MQSSLYLHKVDSELSVRSPSAPSMIKKGISTAPDSMTYYEYEARLAKYYYLSSTPDSLLPIVSRVESYAKREKDSERGRQLLAYAYNTHAIYYHAFHLEPEKQKELYQDAYNLIMLSDNKSEAHKIAANLGDAYVFTNELPKAAAWYRRALFLVDSLDLPHKENITLYLGLANIYQQLGDNGRALQYYQQTEKDYKNMSVGMQAYFLNNFGNYYYYTHDYSRALEKFLSLRKLLQDNGMADNFDMYLCKINLADVYLNLGHTKEATACLDEIESFGKKHGDKTFLFYCNTIRIGIAVKEKNWTEVRRLAAIDTSHDVIPFQLRQIRARYMRDYYIAIGNYAQAYRDVIADEEYNDSLEHNRTNMRTADVISRFATDTLRLHHDVEMQKQKIAYERTYIMVIIAIALIVVLILLLMVFMQRTRKQLAEDKYKIMDLRLKGSRLRISPHFVFNILNNHMLTSTDRSNDGELIELSKLIRENLNLSRHIAVPLLDELDFVRQYVKVEQPIIGSDLDFEIKVDDDIDTNKVKVPSMMIQIIVENSMIHGLSGWDGHKMLHVDVKSADNAILIMVSDNGPGFDTESLRTSNRTGLNIIKQTIAVLNSRSRHKILFKMENLTNGKDVTGCRSTITIPNGALR